MSGESFFSIDHTPQQQPTHKGDATQESKPQDDESRSGIMSYEDLKRLEKAARVKEELARVAKIYDGDADDLVGEKKVKTISPEEAYRQNIEYAKGVTNLVLKMREYILKTRGSDRAEDYLTPEAEDAAHVLGYNSLNKLNGAFDPAKWNDAINDDSDSGSVSNEPTSLDEARQSRREAPAPTNSSSSYYYPEEHAA
jgi:hypothetical protein